MLQSLTCPAGDMPIALMFDGPSLGGFVCPATITSSDLWKMGQLRAGDGVQFKQTTLGEPDRPPLGLLDPRDPPLIWDVCLRFLLERSTSKQW